MKNMKFTVLTIFKCTFQQRKVYSCYFALFLFKYICYLFSCFYGYWAIKFSISYQVILVCISLEILLFHLDFKFIAIMQYTIHSYAFQIFTFSVIMSPVHSQCCLLFFCISSIFLFIRLTKDCPFYWFFCSKNQFWGILVKCNFLLFVFNSIIS